MRTTFSARRAVTVAFLRSLLIIIYFFVIEGIHMLNLTSYIDIETALAEKIKIQPDNSSYRIELSKLYLRARFASAALNELRQAEALGAAASDVATRIATLEFELGRIGTAIAYLEDAELRGGSNPGHEKILQRFRRLEDESAGFADRDQCETLSAGDALRALTAHLAARRYDRVVAMVDRQGFDMAPNSRMQIAYDISRLELRRQAGSIRPGQTIKLGLLYRRGLSAIDRAASALSDTRSELVSSEYMLRRLCGLLLQFGCPLAAAVQAHRYLGRSPESAAARSVLIHCGRLMRDEHCIVGADTIPNMAARLEDVLSTASIFLETAIDPRDQASIEAVAGDHRLFRALARLTSVAGRIVGSADQTRGDNLAGAAYLVNAADQAPLLTMTERRRELITELSMGEPRADVVAAARAVAASLPTAATFEIGEALRPFEMTSLEQMCRLADDPAELHDGAARNVRARVISAEGPFMPRTPDHVFGVPEDTWSVSDFAKPIETIDAFVARLPGARLIGRGLLVSHDGRSIVDVQNDNIRRNFERGTIHSISPSWLPKSNTVIGFDGKSQVYSSPLSGRCRLVGDACHLLDNGQGYNFANWHMYVFPRLHAYFAANLREKM